MIEMLGYDSAEEMEQMTGNRLLNMISPYQGKFFSEKVFVEKTQVREICTCTGKIKRPYGSDL